MSEINSYITVEIIEKEIFTVDFKSTNLVRTNLSNLSDVVINAPQNNDVLGYNSVTGKWINKVLSGADNAITSTTDGDWKRITAIEYNKVTGKIRIKYDDV